MMDAVIASYAGDAPILSLTIADPQSDAYLGAIGGAESGNGAVELFVTLLPSARGKGYATAAMQAVMAHLFETCGAQTLYADTLRENAASIALFERLGFRQEGEVVRAASDGPFANRDMRGVRYVLTRAAYQKRGRS